MPHAKISVIANLDVVIQISPRIIDISSILGYFGASIDHVTSWQGQKFEKFNILTS